LQLQGGIRVHGHLFLLVSLLVIFLVILLVVLGETLGDILGDIVAKYGASSAATTTVFVYGNCSVDMGTLSLFCTTLGEGALYLS
jgi:hypothetical protein